MPKSLPALPLSALFGIVKPSGPSSMSVINDIKSLISNSRLFVDESAISRSKQSDNSGKGKKTNKRRREKGAVKIGQGGTLDPLADGVLVVGVGKGTKKLSQFLDCVKTYRTTALLGAETDSYDSEGALVRLAPWKHVNEGKVREALSKFRGEIYQVPPIFSALKMDGVPLYEYARQNKPLPRAIEKRKVTVHDLELERWYDPPSDLPQVSADKQAEDAESVTGHVWRWPEKWVKEEDRQAMEKTLEMVEKETDSTTPTPIAKPPDAESDGQPAPAFSLLMTVSGGTYVRCIVHDLARAVGSAAHVVVLTRTRQGRFVFSSDDAGLKSVDKGTDDNDALNNSEADVHCIPWSVWKEALEAEEKGEHDRDEDGWCAWERAVIEYMEIVE